MAKKDLEKRAKNKEEESDEMKDTQELNLEADEENEEENEEINLNEVSLEEIMKNPDQFTDDTDVVETTDWCPDCSDYTLFVNGVCTNCGYTKKIRKINEEKDEGDDESSKLDYLGADEDIDELKYGYGRENEDEY